MMAVQSSQSFLRGCLQSQTLAGMNDLDQLGQGTEIAVFHLAYHLMPFGLLSLSMASNKPATARSRRQ